MKDISFSINTEVCKAMSRTFKALDKHLKEESSNFRVDTFRRGAYYSNGYLYISTPWTLAKYPLSINDQGEIEDFVLPRGVIDIIAKNPQEYQHVWVKDNTWKAALFTTKTGHAEKTLEFPETPLWGKTLLESFQRTLNMAKEETEPTFAFSINAKMLLLLADIVSAGDSRTTVKVFVPKHKPGAWIGQPLYIQPINGLAEGICAVCEPPE